MIKKWLLTVVVLITALSVTGCNNSASGPVSSILPTSTAANTSTAEPSSSANQGIWTSFTAGNQINDFLINGNELWAATNGGIVKWDLEKGTFQEYTAKNGLPENDITGVIRDKQGNIWFGTRFDGLMHYDGKNWQTLFDQNSTSRYVTALTLDNQGNLLLGSITLDLIRYNGQVWQTLTSGVMREGSNSTGIQKIVTDRQGNIWTIDNSQLSRYDGKELLFFGQRDGLPDGEFESMVVANDGTLWVGMGGGTYHPFYGLLHYDGQSWQQIPEYGTNKDVTALAQDQGGQILCGIGNALVEYNGLDWQTVSINNLSGSAITNIKIGQDNSLWCSTANGIFRFDGKAWRAYLTDDVLPDNNINLIVADHAGGVRLAADNGLAHYDGKSWQTFTKADGLADDKVTCIFPDSEGNLWAGTAGSGVSKYAGTRWMTLTTKDGLASNNITAIAEDRQGNLWFGNTGSTIDRFDGKTWQTFNIPDFLDNSVDSISSIFVDSHGYLWFATDHSGVILYIGTKWQTFTFHDGLVSNHIDSFLEDSRGSIWGLTEGEGANWYDGTAWHSLTYHQIGSVWAIALDANGNIWLGPTRYDGTSLETFNAPHEVGSNPVFAIARDLQNNLWFGLNAGGVVRYDGHSWQHFSVKDGLSDNNVKNIVVDKTGNIWFNTSFGITRYSPK